MRFLVVFSLLAVAAAGPFDSVDFSSVRSRLRQVHVPLASKEGPGIKTRITNGQPAAAKQFPYQAGLLVQDLNDALYWGGGTLISDQWVLTSASCAVNVANIRVILGTLRSTPLGDIGEVVIDIEVNNKTVIVHPEYDAWTLTNDLALIRLPEPVTFSDYIKPAKLPSFTGRAPTYSWNTAIASGWGKTTDESEEIVNLLRWTDVPVISNAKCATIFGRMETTHLCAQGAGKSTCDGDAGGPLVLEGTDTIIGVASFVVYLACEWGFPAGFSRVTSFLPWIEMTSGVTPEAV